MRSSDAVTRFVLERKTFVLGRLGSKCFFHYSFVVSINNHMECVSSALDAKMDAIMKKIEQLDTIKTQLKEVHTRIANFEETISRLESEVKDLKKQKKKLEKKVGEFEESLQYNEDDISDLQRDNRKLENDVSELKKQLMYMETYSRRENLKFFGLLESSDTSHSGNDLEEESSRQSGTSENTREVLYKFLEE